MRYDDTRHRSDAIREDKYLDNLIKERGLTGCLSSARWVKLIAALAAHGNLIKECQVKLIWEESYISRRLLIDEDTTYNFDYYGSAMESMVTGGKLGGWCDYREIEWLAFYRHPAGLGEQSLEEILGALTTIGQFAFTLTADCLWLDAYRAVTV